MATSKSALRTKLQVVMPDGRNASDMTALINEAIDDAHEEASRFLWERVPTIITGDGTTVRWALTGEHIIIGDAEEQYTPQGLTGYIDFNTVAWQTDEYGRITVEQGIDATGAVVTATQTVGTIATTAAIANLSKVLLIYYRRPVNPATDTNFMAVPERYMMPASLGHLHSYLAINAQSGESENHEKWSQFYLGKAEGVLKELESRVAPNLYRLRTQ